MAASSYLKYIIVSNTSFMWPLKAQNIHVRSKVMVVVVVVTDRQTDKNVFIWGLIQRKYIDYNSK